MRLLARPLLVALLLAILLAMPLAALQRPRRPAVPREAIAAILEVFRTHRVVALGEAHGNEQEHAFLRALIRDPRFAASVNDIVVEFGNSRYQDVMDRFVRGEEIPYDSLRKVWQNTTIPNPGWDRPVYEALFRAVRDVNASLPRGRQLRVLLGDPPVDWDAPDLGGWVPTSTGRLGWPTSDRRYDRAFHAADVMRREVVAKNRRALVIYGTHHVYRGTHLVGTRDTHTFSIGTSTSHYLNLMDLGVESWPAPSLVTLEGTTLGTADSLFMFNPARSGSRAEQVFDAMLYLGPREAMTESQLAPALCADAEYMKMRLGRLALHPSWQSGADGLREYCARVTVN